MDFVLPGWGKWVPNLVLYVGTCCYVFEAMRVRAYVCLRDVCQLYVWFDLLGLSACNVVAAEMRRREGRHVISDYYWC